MYEHVRLRHELRVDLHEVAQLGRQRAGELVVSKVKIRQLGEQPELGRPPRVGVELRQEEALATDTAGICRCGVNNLRSRG